MKNKITVLSTVVSLILKTLKERNLSQTEMDIKKPLCRPPPPPPPPGMTKTNPCIYILIKDQHASRIPFNICAGTAASVAI